MSLQELLAYERKGHVCIRGVLSQDEARPMVSDLIRATKARQLDAYRHRISVLCPGVDADAVASEAEALGVLARQRGGGWISPDVQPPPPDASRRRVLSQPGVLVLGRHTLRAVHPLASIGEGGGGAPGRRGG